jgi:hypothetical protein
MNAIRQATSSVQIKPTTTLINNASIDNTTHSGKNITPNTQNHEKVAEVTNLMTNRNKPAIRNSTPEQPERLLICLLLLIFKLY